jgi:hypothetical protein
VGVPAAGEARGEGADALEVSLFGEQAADYPRELADLDVLEAELPREARPDVLARVRRELPPGGRRVDLPLLELRVAPQVPIEFLDRVPRRSGVPGARGREEAAESVVEVPVLAREALERPLRVASGRQPRLLTARRTSSSRAWPSSPPALRPSRRST